MILTGIRIQAVDTEIRTDIKSFIPGGQIQGGRTMGPADDPVKNSPGPDQNSRLIIYQLITPPNLLRRNPEGQECL